MNPNEKIIAKLKEWQSNPMFHPLTCGSDSNHGDLVPVEKDGNVILKCPDCDYEQYHIPIFFVS